MRKIYERDEKYIHMYIILVNFCFPNEDYSTGNLQKCLLCHFSLNQYTSLAQTKYKQSCTRISNLHLFSTKKVINVNKCARERKEIKKNSTSISHGLIKSLKHSQISSCTQSYFIADGKYITVSFEQQNRTHLMRSFHCPVHIYFCTTLYLIYVAH